MIGEAILEYGTVGAFHCSDIFELGDQCNPEDVHTFEGQVDTTETSLSYLGDRFPNLQKLRLNNSVIPNLRDIGCRFTNLKFLSLARCGITSLNGISTISKVLEELYLAFNKIDDCSELVGMDSLIVLDMEENNISDLSNIEFLSTCSNLKSLTLSGNPCVDDPEEYRSKVQDLIPNLLYLDEKRLKPKQPKVPLPNPRKARIMNEIVYKDSAPSSPEKNPNREQSDSTIKIREPSQKRVQITEPPSVQFSVSEPPSAPFPVSEPSPSIKIVEPSSKPEIESPPTTIKVREPDYPYDDEVIITEMLDDLIEDRPPTSRGNYESKFFKDSFELPTRNKTSKGFKNKPQVVTPRVPRNKNARPVSAARKLD